MLRPHLRGDPFIYARGAVDACAKKTTVKSLWRFRVGQPTVTTAAMSKQCFGEVQTVNDHRGFHLTLGHKAGRFQSNAQQAKQQQWQGKAMQEIVSKFWFPLG